MNNPIDTYIAVLTNIFNIAWNHPFYALLIAMVVFSMYGWTTIIYRHFK